MLLFTRVVVDLDLPAAQLLLLGTAKEVTILIAEIPTGVVADLRSRKTSVVLGFLFAGSGIMLAGLGTTFVVLAFAQVLWGLGSTFRSGAETAWITDEIGSTSLVEPLLMQRARLGLLGIVVGVASAAMMASLWSLGTAMAVIGSVLIARALYLLAVMPETGFVPIAGAGSPLQRFGRLLRTGATTTRTTIPLRRLFIIVALAGFASEAVDRLFVARFDQLPEAAIAVDATLVGAIAIAQALLGSVFLSLTRNKLRGKSLVPWLAFLHLGTAVGVLMLAQGNLLLIAALGVVTTGTLRAVARPIVVAWTNHYTLTENRATIHSFLGQAQSFGEITGGIGLGVLATTFDIATALLVSSGVYFVAAGLTVLTRRLWQDDPPATPATTLP